MSIWMPLVVLAQPGVGEIDHPIDFARRKLSNA